jgi:phosphoenolpyruvate phosphomutase
LTGLLVESARVTRPNRPGHVEEFDALWSSSLTASASKGLPDIETVDTTARLGLVKDTLAVTSKPLIYDGDTGGLPEIFQYTVRSLEDLGVSACIIEDKTGLKQNSLFGTERKQQLESIEDFSRKLEAGQRAKRSEEFMIIARLEALIAGWGLEEALTRARAYTPFVDGIMIHSKDKDPAEVFQFIEMYNREPNAKPIVVVPTTYNHVTEEEFAVRGVKVVIYANHMLRAAYPSMKAVAETILLNGRSLETDDEILPVKEVITLIDSNPLGPDGSSAAKAKPPEETTPAANLEAFMAALAQQKLKFAVGVPDSVLSSVQVALEDNSSIDIVVAANEGAAVAMGAGHYMQTQEVPLVYLQNSGLGNTVNPIMSLCHKEVYGMPQVLLIGWRGAPGHKDEPQHLVQGARTEKMLESWAVPHYNLPRDAAASPAVVATAGAAAPASLSEATAIVWSSWKKAVASTGNLTPS